jgi:four helix bundle protein
VVTRVQGAEPSYSGVNVAVERFEDLIAWQAARVLVRDVYSTTRNVPFANDRSLCNQIQRAGVSAMANIAEGFERGTLAEFRQFLSIAKGSTAEVRAFLYVALDVRYLDSDAFAQLMNQANETGRLIGGLRKSIDTTLRSTQEQRAIYEYHESVYTVDSFDEGR